MKSRLTNINLIKKILIGFMFMFVFGIFTFNNPTDVQAKDQIKNKSFRIYDLGSRTQISKYALRDSDGAYYGGWPAGGSITWSGLNKQSWNNLYYVDVYITNADVHDWTPYLKIKTSGRTGYHPTGWTMGNQGSHGTTNYTGSKWEYHYDSDKFNSDGTCRFYIGMGYAYDSASCNWDPNQYTLHINWNDAKITADGKWWPGNGDYTWGGWYTYNSGCKQLFGGGKPVRDGYTFVGWYCGDYLLYDTNGNVVKNATVSGKQWSDAWGNYKWDGDTWLIPKWVSNKKLTFTYDTNAVSYVDGNNQYYEYYTNATSTVHLKTGYHFVKYHGTNFNGTGEQDWPANGSNFPSTDWTMCADRTINIVTAPNQHILDVNTVLENSRYCGGIDDIRYDVYVNGQLSQSNVTDYYQYLNYGDTYKVVMHSSNKYNYSQSAYTGTMGDSDEGLDIYADYKWFTMTSYHYKWNQHKNDWEYFKTTTESAKWGTTYTPPYKTPTGYHNYQRDWDGGWTVTGDGGFNVYYCPNSYYFDVNTIVNNNTYYDGFSDIHFNVYINGSLVKENAIDYCTNHLYGDTYKIEMITNSKYTYEKQVYEGTVTGETYISPRALSVPIVHRVTTVQDGNDNFYAYGYVTSDGPINRVEFPSWTADNGQDDLLWPWERANETGNWTINGQTYNYRKLIKSSEHSPNGTDGHNWYNVHAYAFNDYGGAGFRGTTFSFRYNVYFNYNKPLNASSDMNGSGESYRTIIYKNKLSTNNGSSKNLPIPSMTGWTFDGWYTAATGGTRVDDNTIYTWKTPITLYAHWTADKYTLTYTANGGNGADYYQTVTYDSYMETLTNRFTKTGYSFVGYKSDRTGEWAKYSLYHNGWGDVRGTVRFYDYTNNKWIVYILCYWEGVYNQANGCLVGNDTLKAEWRANDYTITYNYNKPSNATSTLVNGSTTNKVVTYDKTYGTLPNPSMRGWTFNGWYTSPTGGTKISSDMTYKTPNDITLYAHWSANIYEIKLDSKLEGHTGKTGTTVIYEKFDTGFYSDKACTKQITSITSPKKIGNAFTGYKYGNDSIIDKNGNIVIKTNYFAENVTVTAKWNLNTYNIVFIGNRNSSGGTNVLYYTWADNDNGKKPLNKNGYVRDGWKFAHWNTSAYDYADTSNAYKNNRKYNDSQVIGNQFFIDNLGTDALLDGTSHTVQLFASWRDITVPDIKEVTAEQETLLSKVNSGQLTLTSQSGAYNGELYTNLKIKIDENNANKDASGIKNVSVLVYDKNNTTVQKTYDITNNISYGTNTKYDFGYDGKYYPYSGTYTFKVNLYKEFPNASKLGIYVYCTDAQGNTTKRNDIFTRPSVDIPQDKPIVIPDKPIEGIVIDEINECIYSQYVTVEGSKDFGVGETGITTTWTYGYVERYDLDYREINTEMENEIANNELSADNRMNRSHEIGRDSNGKAPLASVDNQIVRIPPYVLQHLSTPDTTKHDDGTTKYKDLLNNKYTATGYKGTQETGIYNIYNIKDTEYQAVHYRSGV